MLDELARRENVEACHFLICGGPGETEETLEKSFRNSRRLDGTVVMAVVGMRIYPGTPLFKRAVAEGQIGRDADLLQPAYYLAPGLTEAAVFARLQEFARLSPNWIVGDPPPAYGTSSGACASAEWLDHCGAILLYCNGFSPKPSLCHNHETSAVDSPVSKTSLMGTDFNFRFPVLGLLKVAALTPVGWQVTILDEKVEPLDLEQEADLVGITAMTALAPRAYEIADHFRRRGIKVVMGGMHVSALPNEALQHCDSVVVGEAEVLWPRLLADFDRQMLQPLYRHEDGFPSLETLPLPNWGSSATSATCRFILWRRPAAARWTVSSARSLLLSAGATAIGLMIR